MKKTEQRKWLYKVQHHTQDSFEIDEIQLHHARGCPEYAGLTSLMRNQFFILKFGNHGLHQNINVYACFGIEDTVSFNTE